MAGESELRVQAKKAAFEAAYSAALEGEKNPQGSANKAYDQVMSSSPKQPTATLPPTGNADSETDRQQLTEQQMQPAAPQKTAAQKRDEAQQLYDAYIRSDEYKQNLDAAIKAQTDSWMMAALGGNAGPMRPVVDQKEQELKALVDHYKQQMDEEEDQRIRDADMKEIESWSDEDRAALEEYIRSRDVRDDPLRVSNPLLYIFQTYKAAKPYAALEEKYGEERLDELAESYSRVVHEQDAQKVVEDTTAAVDTVPGAVGHNILSVGANNIGGILGTLGRVNEVLNRTGRYKTLEAYTPGDTFNLYASTVRGATAQNIEGEDGGAVRKALSVAYQGIMTLADSISRSLAFGPAGGAALAATGSFSQTVSEATKQGASPQQAVALGVATAGMEYISEKIPMDEVFKLAKAGNTKVLAQAFKQAGVEITTEELSLFGSMAAEAAILQEKSSYRQQIGDLVANGASYEEAKAQADKDVWNEVLQTAAVSGVAGGFSGGGAAIVGNLTPNNAPEVTEEVQQEQPVQTPPAAPVVDEGQQIVDTVAAELAEQAPSQSVEEAAEQLGREAPKAEPVQKTEQEITLDQAMREVLGQEGNDYGSRAAELEQAQAQEESLRRAAEAYANAGDARAVAEVEADRQKYGDQVRAAQTQEEARTGSLTDKDAPAEQETPYPGVTNQDSDPLRARSWAEAGDRKTKAYMAENPEVKPFIQQEAQAMTWELANTTKGERGYNEDTYYESGGEKGWWSVSRHTSEDIAELRDSGMSYEQIGKGLNDIIEDHGKENSAAAKRVEMQLNDRLRTGHKDFMTGKWVQPNQAYIDTVNETEANREGREAFDALMEDADYYATPEQNAERGAQRADTRKSSPQREQPKEKNSGAAESGGFEAMGAADQNFSGKPAYNATLSEDNAQPDRRDDARPMELPERDINGGDVSAVTGNAYGSKITPDEFASLMEEPVAKGDFSYAKITNDRATQMATETIARAGTWENAYDGWKQSVTAGNAGAEMSARGALLLNYAAQKGDKRQWIETLHYMQRLGTNTAQGLQALRIIRTLNAPDKVAFVRMTVQKMVEDMKLGIGVEIDEALLQRYEEATTDEDRDAILKEIQQNVADQIPSTFLDKFTALRYMNMLGNLKTIKRNVLSNLSMKGVYKVKDTVAAGVEELLSAATGGKFQRTKSLTVSSELRKACEADFAQYAGIVSDGGKFGDSQTAAGDFARGVMEKRRIFKGDVRTGNEKFDKTANKVLDVAMAPAEGYRKATNWMMNNKYFGDEAFGRGAYARAMAGYLKANGVKDADLSKVDDALLDRARAYAIQEAQEATFHDNTMLARIVQKGQKALGIVGEGMVPFPKTPANILVRAEEFSPLGLLNSTVKGLQSAAGNTKLAEKNGRLGQWAKAGREITGADIVNSWAKTFTGTALFALGAIMRDQGWLTASADDDEDKAAFDKQNGEQEYAFVLPDGVSYTLEWLGSSVMPIFMGAEMSRAMEEAGGLDEMTWADWENVLTSVSEPLLRMSMLSGIDDSLNNIKYSDYNLLQLCINAAVSYLTQGLTNVLMGQIEKSTEEVRTQTYIDKDSQIPVWMQQQLGKASQKIPFWDYQQTPYIDARGQEQAQPTGFGGWLYNLLSPGYLSKKEVDSVSEELYRLHESGATENNVFLDSPSTTFSYTDKDGVKHEDYNLSAEEAEALKRSVGKTSVEVLQALFETDTYKAMTNQQKTDALKYVDDYAREKGRTEAVKGYEGMSEWMLGIEGNEVDAILDKAVTAAFSDAFSLMDRDMGAAGEALDQAYSLVKGNAEMGNVIMEEAGGETEAFIQAARMGVDGKTFAELYSKYEAIGENKSLDTTQKAQEWAYTLQKAKEDGTIKSTFTMNKLKDLMEFRYSMPAETDKYDLMVEQGVDSDNADFIVGLLDGIAGTGSVDKDTGKTRVTDRDKYDAIAGSKLTEEEKDIAMKAYMDDYDPKAKEPDCTEIKYDYIRQELGYSAEEYAKAYRITSGDGKKDQMIADLKKDIGITEAQAQELYGIISGSKNKQLKDWAEELYG